MPTKKEAVLSLFVLYWNIQIICRIHVKDTSDKGGWVGGWGYSALVDSIQCD